MASRFLGGQVEASCGVDGTICLHELTLNKALCFYWDLLFFQC